MVNLKFPKPPRKKNSKNPPNRDEARFMNRVAELGCIICGGDATIHHVRINNEKRNHYKILPISPFYHLATHGGRESFHGNKKEWELRHGTEEELLIKVYERLLPDLPEQAMVIYEYLKQSKLFET